MADDDHMDDAALWKEETRDVKPLRDGDSEEHSGQKMRRGRKIFSSSYRMRRDIEARQESRLEDFSSVMKSNNPDAHMISDKKRKGGFELDRRTRILFEKGNMPIDARIDLHGKTQDAAQKKLLDFIAHSYARNLRCLLVITGKGTSGVEVDEADWWETPKGVIRKNMKRWLMEGRYAHEILAVSPAQERHGGAGAFYVLLRGKR